ncbi:MAG: MerC domain-containing protein [Pseudomonadota bacterium]
MEKPAGKTASQVRTLADWLGIAASTACAIHCIFVPSLLVLGTVLPAAVLDDELFHNAILWVILPAALVAFGIGCLRHKDRWVMALAAVGLGGMLLAATVLHEIGGEAVERGVTLLSAVVLVYAHYRNFRICRSIDCAS